MLFLINDIINQHLDLLKIAINFFTSQVTNPQEFEAIKKICAERAIALKRTEGTQYIEVGYLSPFDFSMYIAERKLLSNGLSSGVLEIFIKALIEANVLQELPKRLSGTNDLRCKANGDYCKFLFDRDLIINTVGGFNYIVNKYSKSVFKIENTDDNDDPSIGTGFYYCAGNSEFTKPFIVTNKHVVEKAQKLTVYNTDDYEIPYKEIIEDPNRDLAYVILNERLDVPIIHIYPQPDILSEIITIGYPSIPMTITRARLIHS